MTRPISVLLPVYNGSDYLQQTLDSVTAQTFADRMEVLIVNDASIDGSARIIDEWKAQQPFPVTVIENGINLGVCSAFQVMCGMAKGEYLAQLGHDDIWQADHLETLYNALEADPELSAAFSAVDYIDAKGKAIAGYNFHHEMLNDYDHPALLTEMVKRNVLCASSSLFRAAHYSPRFWGVSNEMLQDYELWLNLLLEGGFAYVPQSKVSYRIHQTNLSGGMIASVQHDYERLSAINRVFLSERFLTFYRSLEDNARLGFLRALDEAFTILAARLEGATFAHAQLLERLWFVEDVYQAELNALRAGMALKLGMGRKYHQLRKIAKPGGIPQSALPGLTAYDRSAKLFLDRLTEAGLGKANQVLGDRGFLIITAVEWENCKADPVVAQVARDKRILLFDAENEGRMESGYQFAVRTPLSNKELMAFWRFIEEEEVLFATKQSSHHPHSALLFLRDAYKRTGHFIPKRFRRSLVRLGHRLLDRKG